MLQKRMECFRLLLDHLAWIKHQFLSGIRDSKKAGSLWGMMRGVEGVKKSIQQSCFAKGLGLLCWGFKGVQEEIPSEEASTLQIIQWHFYQDNAPVHKSILVTDYLSKMGIKTVPRPPYSSDLAPCDFWLFPKFTGCRYETIEEMKEAVTKVIETLTQEDIHGAFQELLEQYNKYLSLIGIILRWDFLIWELIFIYCRLFVLILVVFVLFLLSLRFGQISPLAFFRWFTATSDRNAEFCNRIPSNYCDRQQLWKAYYLMILVYQFFGNSLY